MSTCRKQQRSQQPKTTLVFTNLDPTVVTEVLEQNGHTGKLEYRSIPKSIVNTSTFARLMALRVARYGHPLVLDENIQGMNILEVVNLIPEDFKSKITALSPNLTSHLPIPTVQVPVQVPI